MWGDVLPLPDALRELEILPSSSEESEWNFPTYTINEAVLISSKFTMFRRGSQISFTPDEEVGRRLRLSSHSPIECTFTPHGIRTTLLFLPISAFVMNGTLTPSFLMIQRLGRPSAIPPMVLSRTTKPLCWEAQLNNVTNWW